VQLQIAVREFVPAHGKGAAVWLVGVSHIGESNYYARIQKQLDAQTLVLYEGISGSLESDQPKLDARASGDGNVRQKPGVPEPGPAIESRQSRAISSLQSSMAAALGLVFQLDAIDYDRPNFHNCDLSIEQLRRLLAEQPVASGQESGGQDFDKLLQTMEGDSFFDLLVQLGLRVLGANPKFQAMGRLALIDMLGAIQGDPLQLRGLPPDMQQLMRVLVQNRNQKVIADLKTELRRLGPGGSIAVFYGTGHMPDMERRLRQALNYKPAHEIWLTAFSVNLARSGVSPAERQWLRSFVERAMDQFQQTP
jgi:hypothetical protein